MNEAKFNELKTSLTKASALKGFPENTVPAFRINQLNLCRSDYEVVLIGSRALNHHMMLNRTIQDFDIIGPMTNVINFANNAFDDKYNTMKFNEFSLSFHSGPNVIESNIVFDGDRTSTTSQLWDMRHGFDFVFIGKFKVFIAPVEILYNIKLSHRYKPGHGFAKTMSDIKFIRKHFPNVRVHDKFVEQRHKEYVNKPSYKLNVSKEEFFTTNFNYIYDHDTIHQAVAIEEVPAYTKYTTEEVFSSKELFDACPEHVKLNGVLEESYVLAIERVYVPNQGTDYQFDPYTAFEMALNKVCTTITGGWFREYAWENYDKVKSLFNPKYVEEFDLHLEMGLIKPHKSVESKM